MKTRILKITIIITIISLLAYLNKDTILSPFRPTTAQAIGDLTVNWGVPEGNPIFTVTNMAPGQSRSHSVNVTNNASTIRPVGVRGIKTLDPGNLATKMHINISQNGSDLYTNTLSQFFTASSGPAGVHIMDFNPTDSKNIIFKVTFDSDAGNEFQNQTLVFDLHIGISFDLPTACSGINFAGDPIFGTQGNDKIKGTNNNDLIIGFEGDDELNGSNGNDCIIGGPGNDKLNGSNGNDFIFGNEGDDNLDGSNGNDTIFAGSGNDIISGSNGDDRIFGEDGNDHIDGSNGNDNIDGGPGNDTIDGRNGNDTLIGGPGTDTVNGRLGVDTCDAETKLNCEL